MILTVVMVVITVCIVWINPSEEKLFNHYETKCYTNEPARLTFPQKSDAFIQFKNFKNKFRFPYVIYADFECVLEDYSDENITDEMKTASYQKHKPCGYCYYVVDQYNVLPKKPHLYRGENCIQHFLKSIFDTKSEIQRVLYTNNPIIMSNEDTISYNKAGKCHICNGFFDENNDMVKVKDHDHYTGKYIGGAHNKCNLARSFSKTKIPVFFHNSQGYDSHFIIQEIADYKFEVDESKTDDEPNKINIEIIPKTEEKYITYSFKNLQFKDSFCFMASSLDSLVKNLRNDTQYDLSNFKNTIKTFQDKYPKISDDECKLIIRKGVYPYEYMKDFNRFEENKLPQIEMFYSKLNNANIDEKDYKHAINVWNTLKIKNMGEYHDFLFIIRRYASDRCIWKF